MAQDHDQDSAMTSREYLQAYGIGHEINDPSKNDSYTYLKKLGGIPYTIRSVCQVENNRTKEVYASKECKLSVSKSLNKKMVKAIYDEAMIIKKIRHHHIVRFFADENLQEFLERVGKEKVDKGHKNYKDMCQWPVCLFHALGYLHESKICHRDIKPSNILIKGNCIHLTDFGTSKDFSEATTSMTASSNPGETHRYMAPETYKDKLRGRAADVWALGCTVLEICTVASGKTINDLDGHLKGKRPPWFCICSYHVLAWIFLLLVTMEQLHYLLNKGGFDSIASLACDKCKNQELTHAAQCSIKFKKTADEDISMRDITQTTGAPWEKIKQRWLESGSE
ncbi:kinase-like protein [Daldinia caldariorum]|uniref:kinase-like protein n=1 Tax=Daldinia caldariorum TaxID=326644 RepID=UPI0020080716|nr:kinase-like protein [Daldinia caldariorum]KAI1463537.1 kinase-like protein [Daldinia caldariorum]